MSIPLDATTSGEVQHGELAMMLQRGPDAFLRLLAGSIAALTHDKERGERCLKVLRILRNRDDDGPPESATKAVEFPPRDDAGSLTPDA
jgi:hypothetical protein